MSSSFPDAWHWQETANGKYLTSALLRDWQHGFFSSDFVGKTPQDIAQNFSNVKKNYRLKQIHSNIVLPSSAVQEEGYTEGDGIITTGKGQSVWCASADCTPILVADSVSGQVTAIHSGWRGTASEIVGRALNLLANYGCEKQNLLFALGPAISGEVYQVKIEVALTLLKTIFQGSDEEIFRQGYQSKNQVILVDSQPERVRLNVTQVIYTQILQQGIKPAQITVAPFCTYQNPDLFFSYRRTHEKNVQWSGIVANG